jgi:hypothetical protein
VSKVWLEFNPRYNSEVEACFAGLRKERQSGASPEPTAFPMGRCLSALVHWRKHGHVKEAGSPYSEVTLGQTTPIFRRNRREDTSYIIPLDAGQLQLGRRGRTRKRSSASPALGQKKSGLLLATKLFRPPTSRLDVHRYAPVR